MHCRRTKGTERGSELEQPTSQGHLLTPTCAAGEQELQGIVSSRAEGTKKSLLDSFKSAKESAAKTAAPVTKAAQDTAKSVEGATKGLQQSTRGLQLSPQALQQSAAKTAASAPISAPAAGAAPAPTKRRSSRWQTLVFGGVRLMHLFSVGLSL